MNCQQVFMLLALFYRPGNGFSLVDFEPKNSTIETRSQFHQHFTPAFFVWKYSEAFLFLQFGFVIFWHKNIGAKAAGKMLMNWLQGRTIRQNELSCRCLLAKLRLATFQQIVRIDVQSDCKRSCLQKQKMFHWKREVQYSRILEHFGPG